MFLGILIVSISMVKINQRRDKGQPCQTPILNLKVWELNIRLHLMWVQSLDPIPELGAKIKTMRYLFNPF